MKFLFGKIKTLALLLFVLTVAACGGGGGGSSTPPADTSPNAFNFSDQTNVATSLLTQSNTISVSGINSDADILIVGGEYSIDGGAFTSTSGTIANGQSVVVRLTSSATTSTTTNATLTVGGVSDTFSVTTISDTTPDAFSFTDQNDVGISLPIESNSISITGIDADADVSITGGEYAINGGAYTAAAGTVSNGQSIVVRQNSSTLASTSTDVILTIGGVSDTFSVTTLADTTAPNSKIIFPLANSLSTGTSVTIRGTATDDLVTVTSVSVNGVDAISTDSFANWTATIPLSLGDNNLVVSAIDSSGNTNSNAASVAIKRTDAFIGRARAITVNPVTNKALIADADLDAIIEVDINTGTRSYLSNSGTPAGGAVIPGFYSPEDVVYDTARNRALVIDSGRDDVIAVDLTTGERSVPFEAAPVANPISMAIDTVGDRLIVLYQNLNVAVGFDLDTGVAEIVSDATVGGALNPLVNPSSIAVNNSIAYVADLAVAPDPDPAGIIRIDLTTGSRTVLTSNATAVGEFLNFPVNIEIDVANSRALVIDTPAGDIGGRSGTGLHVIAVDLITGIREILWDNTAVSAISFQPLTDIAIDPVNNRALLSDEGPIFSQILAVDLTSNMRTLVSQDDNTLTSSDERLAIPTGMVLDQTNSRLLTSGYQVFNGVIGGSSVKAIDIATGASTIFSGLGIPDNANRFSVPFDIELDPTRNRALVSNVATSSPSSPGITAVDLNSGARTPFSSVKGAHGLSLDAVTSRLFAVLININELTSVDLDTAAETFISNNTIPNSNNAFISTVDVESDTDNNRVFVANQGSLGTAFGSIYTVDIDTGERTLFSTIGDPASSIVVPWDMVLDKPNNRLIVSDIGSDMIIAVDLTTFDRTVLSSSTYPNGNNAFSFAADIEIDPSEPTRAWVLERGSRAIFLVDLVTGERVVFAR